MPAEVDATVVVSSSLAVPTDLEFNPYVQDQLWIMKRHDGWATIVSDLIAAQPKIERRADPEGASHFMPNPAAFALVSESIGASFGLPRPSGLCIPESALYATDNETSRIHTLSITGTLLASTGVLNVAKRALGGLNFGPTTSSISWIWSRTECSVSMARCN